MKLTTKAGLGGLVVFVALGMAAHSNQAASASDVHHETTKTVAWVVTSGSFADRFGTPQRLLTASDTCDVLEQIDLYRYDTAEHRATVDALLAKGTLSSSAEDGSVWISNEDVTLPACETTPPTPPVTTPPVTVPTPPVTTAPPTPPVTTPPATTPPVAPPMPPATTPAATPTPSSPSTTPAGATAPATPTATTTRLTATAPAIAESLAFTGSNDRQTVLGIILGGALLLAGTGLATRAAILNRRNRKATK